MLGTLRWTSIPFKGNSQSADSHRADNFGQEIKRRLNKHTYKNQNKTGILINVIWDRKRQGMIFGKITLAQTVMICRDREVHICLQQAFFSEVKIHST